MENHYIEKNISISFNHKTLSNDVKSYWHYEYEVTQKYMIPLLEKWGVQLKGATLLDVGCGDGGSLSAFYDYGVHCKGFDIVETKIELANILKGNRVITAIVGDLFNNPAPFAGEKFDIVTLHDVFEHLEQEFDTLNRLCNYLKPNGCLMITFPPYYSAFGAHQQLLRSRWGKIPFFHHIPFSLSKILPKLQNEHKPFVEEIQKLSKIKMGIKKFENIVKKSPFIIREKIFYIIGPNHIRYGLKPLEAGIIGRIPYLKEIFVNGVVYLLSLQKRDNSL